MAFGKTLAFHSYKGGIAQYFGGANTQGAAQIDLVGVCGVCPGHTDGIGIIGGANIDAPLNLPIVNGLESLLIALEILDGGEWSIGTPCDQ